MEKIFLTELRAICPKTGELKTYAGINVKSITMKLAQEYCEQNGLGYLKVIGELCAEIDYNTGDRIDYDTPSKN